MKNITKFTEIYRELETELRNNDIDYKFLEENADDFEQNRLRICRQMRNYITHQSDTGFLEITDKQIDFLEQELRKQKENGDVLKKHLKTVKSSCCMEQDYLLDIFAKMNKLSLSYIPVLNESHVCIGILSIHEAIKSYTEASRPKTAKLKNIVKLIPLSSDICCSPLTKIEDVQKNLDYNFIVCTENGEADGKTIGLYIKHMN